MAQGWVYRRPFDYRVFRIWILPAPQLTIEVSDTVTLLEDSLATTTGVGILTPIASDSVTVAETVTLLIPVLFISEVESVAVAEFDDINFGFIVISNNPNIMETVTVAEAIDIKLRLDVTLAGGRLLTMKVGG